MKYKYIFLGLFSFCLFSCSEGQTEVQTSEYEVAEELVVDDVWVANRAFFDFKTVNGKQFVAYYNKNRNMTIAARNEGDTTWVRTVLPNKLHWDTHNYVTVGVDEKGYVHVSGNMHVNPLAYFRSEKPYDVSKMLTLNEMIGNSEDRVTYPNFFNNPSNELFYSYRYGTCGNGNIMVNQFDPETCTWSRYLDEPLFMGVEKNSDRAAYHKFLVDEDGTFHYTWMWRWTPKVETCHQLCYASTKDLKTWYNAAGEEVHLPFTPDNEALIVDPAPTKGGLHNSKFQIITSDAKEPYISYVRYDKDGNTQLYLAKFFAGEWHSLQLTNWTFRWKFIEGGDKMTMGADFAFDGFSPDGLLVISWKNDMKEEGRAVVDTKSFKLVDRPDVKITPKFPASLMEPMTDRGFTVQNILDDGESSAENVEYVLKWETDQATHGKHAPKEMPMGPTSKLLLLKLEK